MSKIISNISIEQITKYTIFGFIALLYIANRHVATKGFYVATIFIVIYLVRNKNEIYGLRKNNLYISSLFLIVYVAIVSSIVGPYSFSYFKYSFRLLIFLSSIVLLIKNNSDISKILKIMVICVLVGSFYDLYQYVNLGNYQTAMPFGVGTKYLWHIFAGGIYAIAAIASSHLTFVEKRLSLKIMFALCWVHMSVLVYLSQSRAALLCYILSFIVFFVLSKRSYLKAGILMLIFIIAIAGTITSRNYKITSLIERGDASRFEIWSGSLDLAKDNLLLGHGLGEPFYLEISHGKVTGPHNLYLYTVFSSGLVGLFLLLILLIIATKSIFRNRNAEFAPLMAAILLFVSAFNFFDSRAVVDNIGVGYSLFWFPIGLISAFSNSTVNEN